MERVVVITGGTGGLGTALAGRLAAEGHRLALTYLMPDEAVRFENELPIEESSLMLRRVDATDDEAVTAFMDEVADTFGAIHGVFSLVGRWAGGRDVERTDNVRFERMLDVNLRSAFYTARAAIPHLKQADFGRLVLVASRAAFETPAGQAAFNVSKAGVVALGRTIALELDATNVTTTVLLPAVIDTPATRATLPHADYMTWPTPDEIAAVAQFLVTEEAGVMNGATIPVYGRA